MATVDLNYRKTLNEIIAGKSVPTPSAQSATLCATPGGQNSLEIDKKTWVSALNARDSRLAMVLQLLFITGARVGELLSVRHNHITSAGQFKIVGKKGSKSSFYDSGEFKQHFLMSKRVGVDPFDGINRYYVYREFKKIGCSVQFEGHHKAAVTHLPRHLFARDIDEVVTNKAEISQALRHVNESNFKHYVGK